METSTQGGVKSWKDDAEKTGKKSSSTRGSPDQAKGGLHSTLVVFACPSGLRYPVGPQIVEIPVTNGFSGHCEQSAGVLCVIFLGLHEG